MALFRAQSLLLNSKYVPIGNVFCNNFFLQLMVPEKCVHFNCNMQSFYSFIANYGKNDGIYRPTLVIKRHFEVQLLHIRSFFHEMIEY